MRIIKSGLEKAVGIFFAFVEASSGYPVDREIIGFVKGYFSRRYRIKDRKYAEDLE